MHWLRLEPLTHLEPSGEHVVLCCPWVSNVHDRRLFVDKMMDFAPSAFRILPKQLLDILVDGIQVQKVGAVSQSKPNNVWI
jgi:hypothetical protein